MTLFLSLDALRERKRALADPVALGGLAASLQHELHQALDVPVPDGKSRLTRQGGRCPSCTVLLDFDPRSPHAHSCPNCRSVHTDRAHHEWWLMNAHLWTAEQCTRAAAIAYLCDDERAGARADDILATYTDRYLAWSNRDNTLGPTRPFFSTYLESIWLLHLASALDLREAAAGCMTAGGSAARERLIAPSAALIASFDEGRSNRQVWHAAALLAASRLLRNERMRDGAALSLVTLMREGLHTDGSWYEGENYHLFAHRGLLSAVTIAEQAGVEIPSSLMERFDAGFAAPFRTVLPDGLFPARRDSQYGVTLRQYRTADWIECGFARNDTPELRSALASLYADWPSGGDTGRSTSSADAERNRAGVRLTRADCNWRTLLLARPTLPLLADAVPRSELLEGQGLAVFRRHGGRFWVGLDYGDPGAGHGHPDRLNLIIATRHARWLDDVGTGSYTAPTLSWYRSSMAHNAPVVDGQDQGAARSALLAHDEQQDAGWVSASFTEPRSQVHFVRTVVVMRDHVLDELTWSSAAPVTVDLPMQVQLVELDDTRWVPFTPRTAHDAHLAGVVARPLVAGVFSELTLCGLPSPASSNPDESECTFVTHLLSDTPAMLWRAATIGPPAGAPHELTSLRQQGCAGRSVRVIAPASSLTHVAEVDASVQVISADGSIARHRRGAAGWVVQVHSADATHHLTLGGVREHASSKVPPPPPSASQSATRLCAGRSIVFELGAPHYRRTEEAWEAAGQPTASVAVQHDLHAIRIDVSVALGRAPRFAVACDANPLDNELADINSDGVQLHWRSIDGHSWNSALVVPEGDGVRLQAAEGTLDGLTVRQVPPAMPGASGFQLHFALPWTDSSTPFEFDCCVNECPPGRERRRGQLVLSGARGEFGYLRGPRQSDAHAIRIILHPAQP